MTRIDVDRESMGAVFKKPEELAADVSGVLGKFSSAADGGIASDKIAFIVRAAMEAAQMSVDAANGVCAIGRSAVDGHMETEEEIMDALDNFADKANG